MKFLLEPKLPDGGGDLVVTADTAEEVRRLIREYDLFCTKSCDVEGRLKALLEEKAALEAGTYTHRCEHQDPETHRDPHAWYEVEGDLGGDHPHLWNSKKTMTFLEPYLDCMRSHLGFEGPLPDMDLTPKIGPIQFKATRIVMSLWIKDQVICYKAFDNAGAWNGRDAKDNAAKYTWEHLAEEFGTRRHEPEYISVRGDGGGGLIKHNPDYLKQHKPQPALGSDWLLNCLIAWWRKNIANERQKEVMRLSDELMKKSKLDSNFRAHYSGTGCNCGTTYGMHYSINYPDPNGTVNWDSEGTKVMHMEWKEFAALK